MVTFKLCVSACACAWAQHPQPVQLIITLLLFACLYIFYLIFFFILLRNLFPAPWVVSHYGVKKNLCGICVDSTKMLTFLLRPLFLLSLPLLLLVFFFTAASVECAVWYVDIAGGLWIIIGHQRHFIVAITLRQAASLRA